MAKGKKRYWILAGAFCFIVYFLVAAKPMPKETILIPRWLSSLELEYPASLEKNTAEDDVYSVPFILGQRFGYIDRNGRFLVNKAKSGSVSLSPENWAEYKAIPEEIEVLDSLGGRKLVIENPPGYPFFLDNRIFLLHSDGTGVSALDDTGELLWTYEFGSYLTCVDAGGGFFLAGALDGAISVLNSQGEQIFSFESGGSRIAGIMGCALSKDGSRAAVISGIDDQRFLLLERRGDSYQVIYHEFLKGGFRRAVHVEFIDQDRLVVFERENGLGLYDIEQRRSLYLPLKGSVAALEAGGDDGLFFFIISRPADGRKYLVALKLPETIIMEAPFESADVFLGRRGPELYLGGGTAIVSFELGTR